MDKNIKPDELMELYQTARQVIWRYNLDKMEIAALKTAMKSIEKAAYDILSNPSKRMSRWEQLRRQDLIQELESLTAGIREQVTGEISSLASQAGAESANYHSQTMSVGGKLPGFNNVALSPEQFQSFFETTPMGGYVLSDWVNRAFDATVQKGLLEDLGAGMLQGKGYHGLVDNIMGHMQDFTRKEAVTLARTFVQTANVSAMSAVMAANSDIVKGWRWSSVLENSNLRTGTGTCIRCACNDGNQYKLGEGPPIPLHPNCLTAETPVFAPDKIAAFVATYEGIVFEFALASGARFTVTPKHMFLTGEGFSTADSIRKGDKIFHNPVADRVIFGCPDNNRNDSSIANVIKSFSKTPGVVSTSVPASSEHLHGDGEFIKGNVEVITFESLLRGDLKSFRSEFLHQFNLSVANVNGLALDGLSHLLSPLFWLSAASKRFVSGLSVSDVFGTASLRHHEAVGVGTPTPFNPFFGQNPGYDIPGNIKFFGNSLFRDLGNIKGNNVFERELISKTINMLGLDVKGLDASFFNSPQNSAGVNSKFFSDFSRVYSRDVLLTDVVSIKTRKFFGHVYDLQCLSGMYHVDGVLSSNCRCVKIPVTVTFRDLGIDIDEFEEVARPWTTRPDIPIGEGGRNILTWGSHKGEYSSWFESRGEQFQKKVVGQKRLALIQSGKVTFKDLVDPETGRLYRIDELGIGGIKASGGTPALKTFKPAKTIKEATVFAKEKLKLSFVDFNGLDLEVVNGMNRTIYNTKQIMPDIRTNGTGNAQRVNKEMRDFIRSEFKTTDMYKSLVEKHGQEFGDQFAKTIAKKAISPVGSDTFAYSTGLSFRVVGGKSVSLEKYSGVYVNQKFGKDAELINSSVKRSMDRGWFAKGSADFSYVMTHEMAHEIDASIGFQKTSLFKEIYDRETKLGVKSISERLSIYGATAGNSPRHRPHEMIAEAWAEFMTSKEPRPLAVEIGNAMLDTYYEQKNFGSETSKKEWKKQVMRFMKQ